MMDDEDDDIDDEYFAHSSSANPGPGTLGNWDQATEFSIDDPMTGPMDIPGAGVPEPSWTMSSSPMGTATNPLLNFTTFPSKQPQPQSQPQPQQPPQTQPQYNTSPTYHAPLQPKVEPQSPHMSTMRPISKPTPFSTVPFEYDSYTAAELSSPTATKTSTATTQYTHPPQPQSQQISVPPATPPVTAPDSSSCPMSDRLTSLQNVVSSLEAHVQTLIQKQRQWLQAPNTSDFESLSSAEINAIESLERHIKEIHDLLRTTVMEASDVERARALLQEMVVMQNECQLLQREMIGASRGDSSPRGFFPSMIVPMLVIRKQPFPTVLRKNEQLSDVNAVEVQLFIIEKVSYIQATVVTDNPHVIRGVSGDLFEPVCMPLDGSNIAHFNLKFKDGTKNTAVAIKFSVQLQQRGSLSPIMIESQQTQAVVVTTHKDQWKGSAGAILKRDCFGSQMEIPWAQLANTLQRHFVRCTKQDPISPKRALSLRDFRYFHKTFFNEQANIYQKDFDSFWNWLGSTLNTLRHQRPILSLWLNGLVYGFVNKFEVDSYLSQVDPGTFIVRFSETYDQYVTCLIVVSQAGSFAIGYKAWGDIVRHYLVTAKDHALHKTLPDFICGHGQFVDLLQLTRDPTSGDQVLVKVRKHPALEPFCSRKQTIKDEAFTARGYTPL